MEATAFARWATGSSLAYPVANVAHVLGLVLLLGPIGLLDLRLLGAFPALPVAPLAWAATPLALGGLLLMLASGSVLFASDARALANSALFGWKLGAIGLALLNAALFRRLWPGPPEPVPPAARALALASLLLWTTAAVLGRLIAYF